MQQIFEIAAIISAKRKIFVDIVWNTHSPFWKRNEREKLVLVKRTVSDYGHAINNGMKWIRLMSVGHNLIFVCIYDILS